MLVQTSKRDTRDIVITTGDKLLTSVNSTEALCISNQSNLEKANSLGSYDVEMIGFFEEL